MLDELTIFRAVYRQISKTSNRSSHIFRRIITSERRYFRSYKDAHNVSRSVSFIVALKLTQSAALYCEQPQKAIMSNLKL